MTTIRATCPTCGEVDLAPHEIALFIVREADAPVGPDSRYAFTCPSCGQQVAKPADERIAHLLATGGVDVTVVDDAASGAGSTHPEEPPPGPPLTHDDLLDLHELLAGADWFAELVSLTAGR